MFTLTYTFGRLTTTLLSLTFRRALDEHGRWHAPCLVCHGCCCSSGPWLLLFSASPIQCSTVAALLGLVTPLAAHMPSRRFPFPLAFVEGLAPATAAAQVGAGAPPLGADAAATVGAGELCPWRHRRRTREGSSPRPPLLPRV
jgi:hypothetical protein